MKSKDYKRWFNLSLIVCNNNYDVASEILQELLVSMFEKDMMTDERMNDNYIFLSLKNRFRNYIRKEKNKKEDDYIIESDYETDGSNWASGLERLEDTSSPDDIERLIEKNIEDQQKIDMITTTILTLDIYDKKLYQLHFIWGLSQREIAKKIGVSHMTINMRVNKIKDKIKESYEKRR